MKTNRLDQTQATRLSVSRQSQSGFSTIEALIASVIVSVGLLGAAKFQAEMIQQGSTVKDRTLALSEANKFIEQTRYQNTPANYTALINGTDTSNSVDASISTFTRTWTVVDHIAPGPLFKHVKVDIDWMDSAGISTVSLASYISKYDIVQGGRSLLLQSQGYPRPQPTDFEAIIYGTIDTINGNGTWSVSVDQGACQTIGSHYKCSVPARALNATQAMTVTFTASDVICGGFQASYTLSAATPVQMQNFAHATNVNKCP